MKRRIVWGTCWFNEPIDTLVDFFVVSIKSLSLLDFDVTPIIFDAKLSYNQKEIDYIKTKIKNVIILQNCTDIFPNKNYGVALITKKANELNIKYTAIVDCDWSIKENISFVNNTVLPLINNNYDIVIPNIGQAAGRSNLLVGRTAINLFYPEYKDILLTAFPGSLVGMTSKLHKIVTDDNYHYDWGGEWDIISLAIKNNMKINSSYVDVENIRHRPNTSKILDSFQIWRAVLGNNTIVERFDNLNNCINTVKPYDGLSKLLLIKDYTALEMIEIINNYDSSETQKQILYMILYPIAFLIGELNDFPLIEYTTSVPYDKKELNKILDLAIYCARTALKNCDITTIRKRCNSLKGEYLSNWTKNAQNGAIKNYKEVL